MPTTDQLVEDNLRLVHSCCQRFKNNGIEYEDLYQVGCVGLIKAADNFDESLGYSFSTYAVPVILGEIKRLFRDTGPIKISRSLKELSYKTVRAKERLSVKQGREPSVKELADELGVSAEDVAEALCASQSVLSMTCEGEDGEVQMDLPAKDESENLLERISVENALDKLQDKDKKIIILRYYKQKTQRETADTLGMTQVQVSRRERVILSQLRKMLA